MRAFTVRMVFSGLALSPALILLLASPSKISQFASLAGGTHGVVMASAAIAFTSVVVAHLLPGKRNDPKPFPGSREAVLLRPTEIQRFAQSAPQGHRLNTVLDNAVEANSVRPSIREASGPDGAEQTIAKIMRTTMAQMGLPSLTQANDLQKLELFACLSVLRASPQQAGDLARAFRNPDSITRLRDRVGEALIARSTFEQQRQIFETTNTLWIMRPSDSDRGLLASLQRFGLVDADLWHHVVVNSDLRDPQQQQAAHWCLAQSNCDQGTAAAFLQRVVVSGHLSSLLNTCRKDPLAHRQLKQVRAVFRRWTSGFYKVNEIALAPPTELPRHKAAFDLMFETLLLKQPEFDMPYPAGMFVEGQGRAPKNRRNWCLRSGQMMRKPEAEDYIEMRQAG